MKLADLLAGARPEGAPPTPPTRPGDPQGRAGGQRERHEWQLVPRPSPNEPRCASAQRVQDTMADVFDVARPRRTEDGGGSEHPGNDEAIAAALRGLASARMRDEDLYAPLVRLAAAVVARAARLR